MNKIMTRCFACMKVFLAVLGVIMAVVSFLMDWGISTCNTSRLWLYSHLGEHIAAQYFAWVVLPVFLVLFRDEHNSLS